MPGFTALALVLVLLVLAVPAAMVGYLNILNPGRRFRGKEREMEMRK